MGHPVFNNEIEFANVNLWYMVLNVHGGSNITFHSVSGYPISIPCLETADTKPEI